MDLLRGFILGLTCGTVAILIFLGWLLLRKWISGIPEHDDGGPFIEIEARTPPEMFCGIDLRADCEWCGVRNGEHEFPDDGSMDPFRKCWLEANGYKGKNQTNIDDGKESGVIIIS